jgi:predicted amidophosphoribosyltransferase
VPDFLYRLRSTKVQDGMSRDARFANLSEAIGAVPKTAGRLKDRKILLIDDVMTSGATLAATTEACHAAGAGLVDVLVLARVAKDV